MKIDGCRRGPNVTPLGTEICFTTDTGDYFYIYTDQLGLWRPSQLCGDECTFDGEFLAVPDRQNLRMKVNGHGKLNPGDES